MRREKNKKKREKKPRKKLGYVGAAGKELLESRLLPFPDGAAGAFAEVE